ncbi:MAG: FtsW/RodA/SpoVE family cell cycle protein [Muribaculaceae bacterium]|nr:FtsW/RodA/SpoVE family cell cycle protein [Muribaculaceae bacterium]
MNETDTILDRAMADRSAPSARADYEAIAEPEKRRTDRYIWGTYLLLLLVSLIELFSASSQEVTADNIYGPIIRHAQFLGIGLLIMLGLQKLHYKWIYHFTPPFVLASIVAMVLVLLVGVNINGARRGLGVGSFVILPAEFIKLSAALGMAWILARNQLKKRNDVSTRGVVYCVILVSVCCGLLFSHGLTNTVLIMAISLSMMLIGGVSMKKFLVVILFYGCVGSGAMLYKMNSRDDKVTEQAVRIAELNKEEVGTATGNRSDTWTGRLKRHFRLEKYNDPIDNLNKQEQFSYMAQAHGGVFGVGPGNSRENARLPLAFSDYIYAIVIEECGMATGVLVLLLYLCLLARAARIAVRFKQTFPCLLVIGCAVYIVYQALFHMAIVSGVFPVSGQPLPLISKGGTSILVTSIALGIMLSVSRHAAVKGDKEAIRAEMKALPENLHSDNPSQL